MKKNRLLLVICPLFFGIPTAVAEDKEIVVIESKHVNNGDYSNQDLSYQNLNGRDFSYTNCCNTNFSHADVRHVNFKGADLRGANFSHARIDDTIQFDMHTVYDETTIIPQEAIPLFVRIADGVKKIILLKTNKFKRSTQDIKNKIIKIRSGAKKFFYLVHAKGKKVKYAILKKISKRKLDQCNNKLFIYNYH